MAVDTGYSHRGMLAPSEYFPEYFCAGRGRGSKTVLPYRGFFSIRSFGTSGLRQMADEFPPFRWGKFHFAKDPSPLPGRRTKLPSSPHPAKGRASLRA
jgi:hypothetical protein